MSKFVKLTCTEYDKEGRLCKYDIRFRAADVQVMVSSEIK